MHEEYEMIKALFFDIDGTLVSFNTHQIPQSAIQAITRAKEKGIKIYISTGRPLSIIRKSKCSRISKRKVHFTKRKV